jgi:hypothetical protein
MLKYAEKPVVRAPLAARPQPNVERKSLRKIISERFSKSLEYLAK